MRPAPPHSIAAHAAIAVELVRLTLGQPGPARPELAAPVIDDRTQHARPSRPRRPRRKR